MIAALFELLKCRRELLSSPFRVTVHGVKGSVILLSLPHSRLCISSRFPPNRATAPCERTGQKLGAEVREAENYGTAQPAEGQREASFTFI